ncbi:claudin-34-like [Sardina pilchardus]|uniref:claudin-34-like n=1 Tax=Sardina pilchardus TaxID=27697 RepID=UPI002E16893B
MAYLAHTAHAQLVGLSLGSIGWILTMVAIGMVEWRVWVVADLSVVSSGLAWVGIWRVCFYSHTVVTSQRSPLYCQKMDISDSFVPMEIAVAQVLMLLALGLGLLANASTLYGLRNVFFGLDGRRAIRVAFTAGGLLHLLSSLCALLPLSLNLHAVATDQNIGFPENFHMPPAPARQDVGQAIGVGITGAVLSVAGGVVFLCYRYPVGAHARVEPWWADADSSGDLSAGRSRSSGSSLSGRDNLAYESQEHV